MPNMIKCLNLQFVLQTLDAIIRRKYCAIQQIVLAGKLKLVKNAKVLQLLESRERVSNEMQTVCLCNCILGVDVYYLARYR